MTTSGPLAADVVGGVLEDHQRVQRERAVFVATLDRLAPGVCAELRNILNEANQVLDS